MTNQKTKYYNQIILAQSVKKATLSYLQIFTYPLFLLFRIVIVRNKLYREFHLKELTNDNIKSFVIYANHQSKLDPFLICASLPIKTIKRLLPFRFFVKNSLYYGFNKFLLKSAGCFPAQFVKNDLYGLGKARVLLRANQTIVIFPQGMRTKERIAKNGIAELANEPNVYLIPININWTSRWHCHIHIGKPFNSKPGETANQLMDRVYELSTLDN